MPATLDTPTPHLTRTNRPRPAADRLADAARVALLAGPTALAFFAGGYFDGPRAWAGVAAWLLVVVTAVVYPRLVTSGYGSRPSTYLAMKSFMFAPFAACDTAPHHSSGVKPFPAL